ncbi:baseplate J/gp47 family protein [Klebsiella pneumoniae]|uniref:baseplate J/gp47 family protein n=1 Tax=Klebsiella pneumoniae TaxID=573 RepID=UPI00202F0B8F|nr:baseplate J/gp47 family protein [Klebsiella pneumoniae]URU47084.1 baseplate J/gp47 family protein [Klebsiella pneumoniae]
MPGFPAAADRRVCGRAADPPCCTANLTRQPGGALHDYVIWALRTAGYQPAWAFDCWHGLGTVGLRGSTTSALTLSQPALDTAKPCSNTCSAIGPGYRDIRRQARRYRWSGPFP